MKPARRTVAVLVLACAVALTTAFAPEGLTDTPTPDLAVAGPGHVFASAPEALPVEPLPEATLAHIRAHLEAGDDRRALHEAQRFVDTPKRWGRDRAAAWLVIGLIHREAERHNLASEAFTAVRTAKGPLASWGAYHEAEQDLLRGREWVAINECESYAKEFSKGPHVDACLRLTAMAHARLGHVQSAIQAAKAYDDDHSDAPIREQVELQLAMWQADHEPEAAVARFRQLAVIHGSPLTGRFAEEQLSALAQAGVEGAELPTETGARQLRATSLRDVKRKPEAWALFTELSEDAADDPALAGWVEEQSERFGWRTHQWDFLVDWYGERYAETGAAEDAWSRYRVLGRGGRWAEAAEYGVDRQAAHAGAREWRHKEDELGQSLMLAGRYAEARDQFDAIANRGGWRGRRAGFFAGFSAVMAGELDDAVARFSEIIDRDRSHVVESRYWRSRALISLEQTELASADADWVLDNDRWSWYSVLLRQQADDVPQLAPFRRDGSWVGAPPTEPPQAPTGPYAERPASWLPTVPAAPEVRPAATGFAGLLWNPMASAITRPPPSVVQRYDEIDPPTSYRAGALFEPEAARDALRRFAERHHTRYPELRAVHDLASVGLYDLSGPMLSRWYEDWRSSYKRGGRDARKVVGVRSEQWREMFMAARDHHHSARFTHGLWDDLDDPELSEQALRLAHPLAHDRTVWAHSRAHGIDPYLVLGLMRQESTYNSVAVSRVGARGAMQIMPRTGHLLSDLAHDTEFTAGDLEDPLLSVGYGIGYLGLLMERFDGAYPLAIASYNGGPFNVSSWLAGTGSDMPMDAFVEHIPFRETRDYVKKVSAGYAGYLALYAPEGSTVVLPPTPRGDHPEIVDF